MPTTQSEDPNERVCHPRHYNQHSSNIETIELIEHLPCNFANAVKYLWRCGLKATETPLRDLSSAEWYTLREQERIRLFELENEPPRKTDVVWRALAKRVIGAEAALRTFPAMPSTLEFYLSALLQMNFPMMLHAIRDAKKAIE